MHSFSHAQKIALGTAQFGLHYGIANADGQVPRTEVSTILGLAQQHGIHALDTAIAYGDSESVLGAFTMSDWHIISKLPAFPDTVGNVENWVDAQVNASLQRLKTDRLHALLLHRPAQLLGPHGQDLYVALLAQQRCGKVGKIGISIYDPAELDQLMPAMHFDVVQAPYNVLDTRLMDSGWMTRLASLNCELHVRSVFLQGLLLMPTASLPQQFGKWKPLWTAWHAWLQATGQTPLQACLQHVLAAPGIAKVVLGVDSAAQLEQILFATEGSATPLPASLVTSDPQLLNPSLWNTL